MQGHACASALSPGRRFATGGEVHDILLERVNFPKEINLAPLAL